MFFTEDMSKRKLYFYAGLTIMLLMSWIFWGVDEKQEDFSKIVKIAVRNAGNQLLLSHQDSTSRVLPVLDLGKNTYQLSFEKELSVEPDHLVATLKNSFVKASLPNSYRVEVIQCEDDEIAYSYLVQEQKEKDIIPCAGRFLPQKCYTIEVEFIGKKELFFDRQVFLIALILLCVVFVWDIVLKAKKEQHKEEVPQEHLTIGNLLFYPEQNKLVKQATEIPLSKKECELLAILVVNVNQVVKRDELTKRVWEDNGVFVGRSLDTYISKLRKKLKEEPNVQLTNVHGVGYKLIIQS